MRPQRSTVITSALSVVVPHRDTPETANPLLLVILQSDYQPALFLYPNHFFYTAASWLNIPPLLVISGDVFSGLQGQWLLLSTIVNFLGATHVRI